MDAIDKTFETLKKMTYSELRDKVLSKHEYLFECCYANGSECKWPPGIEDILDKSGWTKAELFEFIMKRKYE